MYTYQGRIGWYSYLLLTQIGMMSSDRRNDAIVVLTIVITIICFLLIAISFFVLYSKASVGNRRPLFPLLGDKAVVVDIWRNLHLHMEKDWDSVKNEDLETSTSTLMPAPVEKQL